MSSEVERRRTLHELDCWEEFFDALWTGDKSFEVRREEPGAPYEVGDLLELNEMLARGHVRSGRHIRATVRYILRDDPWGYLADDVVVLGLDIGARLSTV